MKVKIVKLKSSAQIPEYKSDNASGVDLHAASFGGIELLPGDRVTVPTGLAIELPEGYEAQIRSRSGRAERGIVVANSPGTIDADYRGEIKVILANIGKEPYLILPNERIAQMVVAPVFKVEFVEEEALSETERAEGGFGSTGKF